MASLRLESGRQEVFRFEWRSRGPPARIPQGTRIQETRRQAEIVMMGACDREALQAERHALATRVAELERQLAAFTPQVTAPSSRTGSMDITTTAA